VPPPATEFTAPAANAAMAMSAISNGDMAGRENAEGNYSSL
jgi:hypothetical protein